MVYCILDPGRSQQTLTLYYAKGKGEEDYIPITEASAYIILGRDTIGVFEHVEGPTWTSSPEIKNLVTYKLLVRIPGKEDITARTTVPGKFTCHNECGYFGVLEPFESFQPVRTGHHLWIVARKNKHRPDEGNDENYPYILTDNVYADNFNLSGLKFSDVSFEYAEDYDYFWDLTRERVKLYPDIPLHKGFVRIDLPPYYVDAKTEEEKEEADYPFYEGFLLLCVPFEQGLDLGNNKRSHFDFYSLSDEYDTFLRNVYVKEGELEYDMTSVYSMSNVYTNIEGGLGIFGAIFRVNFLIV